MADDRMRVEVACARPERQEIIVAEVERNATVGDAIRASGICTMFPEIDPVNAAVGVFGKRATLDSALHEGDRVEIYRPLIADPKQARRQRAARTAGGKRRARPR
jgi:hypothetical protein